MNPPALRQFQRWCLRIILLSVASVLAGCSLLPSAQPVPWPQQLAMIERRAHAHDPTGVLYRCITSLSRQEIVPFLAGEAVDLRIHCEYIRPDGTLFMLSYDEPRIAQTLQVDTKWSGSFSPFSPADYAQLQPLPATIAIGPLEALAAAQAEASSFFSAPDAMGNMIIIGLDTHPRLPEDLGVQAAWTVVMLKSPLQEQRMWVDVATGAVLQEQAP